MAALTEENTALRQKLDALALELARREGDAQASGWTIAELEGRLAAASAAPPPVAVQPSAADLQHRLGQALDELDALRQAFSQEHEARARAESGEELTRARAEIQRQATLLEQLGQKLQAGSRTLEESGPEHGLGARTEELR
jgi:predicted  nucleic acid-binding Zn-ribbon protein